MDPLWDQNETMLLKGPWEFMAYSSPAVMLLGRFVNHPWLCTARCGTRAGDDIIDVKVSYHELLSSRRYAQNETDEQFVICF